MRVIPGNLICLLKNWYAGQEAMVRTIDGTMDWFIIWKECIRAAYCHPVYLAYMQITSWKMSGCVNHKQESRLLGEISTSCWELKSRLKTQHSKNKNHGIQSRYFMADKGGEKDTVTDFNFLCSKITATMNLKDVYYLEEKVGQTSLQFHHSVVSDSLWLHGVQHARLPCPSTNPRAYSNSCSLSQWWHPTNSSSVVPFSSRLQSFPVSGSFQWVCSLQQVAKLLELQFQHQSFQWYSGPISFRIDWFDFLAFQGTLKHLLLLLSHFSRVWLCATP